VNVVKTFAFSGAGTLSWQADADYELVALGAQFVTAGAILVTTDATLTVAGVTAAIQMFSEILSYIGGGANGGNNRSGLSVPVPSGTTLFVRASSSSVINLYLEPSAEPIAT
jgi:hypothetical protein